MQLIKQLICMLWKNYVFPKSTDKDAARREFVLNILLVGLIFLAFIAFIINLLEPFLFKITNATSPFITGAILLLLCGLLALSRYGKSRIASYIFTILLLSIELYLNYDWGADLPTMLLFSSLVVIIAGILINTKYAIVVTTVNGLMILFFTYLESSGAHNPGHDWKVQQIRMTDSIVNFLLLGIIAIVSWLFNREMEHALQRAQKSESALKKQRDKLEIEVDKRTKELKMAQAEKLMQLYRFAELGKLSSGLFHDLVTPLNLVSLNLQKLNTNSKRFKSREEIKIAIERALLGTERLEKFLDAAKKQIQNQEIIQVFSVNEEIEQVIQMLSYKARSTKVEISFNFSENIQAFGNPIKLNQVMTNLISNAIDSYDGLDKTHKLVEVTLNRIEKNIFISTQDWGMGIDTRNLPMIFDPLFTTKPFEKGTGIGLSICKAIINKDFKGKIDVKSTKGYGSTFTILFPIKLSAGVIKKERKNI